MKIALASLAAISFIAAMTAPAANAAQTETDRWCVVYGSDTTGLGVRHCYFRTLSQCRQAITGQDGACEPSEYHDSARRPAPTGR